MQLRHCKLNNSFYADLLWKRENLAKWAPRVSWKLSVIHLNFGILLLLLLEFPPLLYELVIEVCYGFLNYLQEIGLKDKRKKEN